MLVDVGFGDLLTFRCLITTEIHRFVDIQMSDYY